MFCYTADLGWDAAAALAPLGAARACRSAISMRSSPAIAREARPGDHVLVMSNGGFGGIHAKLLAGSRHARPVSIVYLHGFNSAPQSHKAQVHARATWPSAASATGSPVRSFRTRRTTRSPWSKREIARAAPGARDAASAARSAGSTRPISRRSTALRAVLLNPAVRPGRDLESYLGMQRNLYTGEAYELTREHIRAMAPPGRRRGPSRTLSADRRDRRRGARLPRGGRAVRRRAAGDRGRRRRSHAAELSRASAAASSSSPACRHDEPPRRGTAFDERPLRGKRQLQGRRRAHASTTRRCRSRRRTASAAKIKSANVLLRFERAGGSPSCSTAAERVRRRRSTPISSGKLRRGASSASQELAREYDGREPSAARSGGRCCSSCTRRRCTSIARAGAASRPRRRKRSRSRSPRLETQAPAAGADRRLGRRSSSAPRLPERSRARCRSSCYKPDRNRAETKAFEQACAELGLVAGAAARALRRASPRAHDYHLGRFLFEHYPRGTGFPGRACRRRCRPTCRSRRSRPSASTMRRPRRSTTRSRSRAARTDWCASACTSPRRRLGFAPGSAIDAIARERLSTAYMPGTSSRCCRRRSSTGSR